MDPIALTTEIRTLAWSIVLLLIQIGLQSILATAEYGVAYNASPRDEDLKPRRSAAGRAERALKNFIETYPAFVGLALALVVTGRTGGWGASGALIWLCARVAYIPAYLLGVPYLRSAIWIISVIGLFAMFAQLLL